MHRAFLVVMAIAALVGSPDRAAAQHAGKGQPRDPEVAADGAKVAADAQTGKLRPPTREEVEQLMAGMKPFVDQSSDGLREIQGAGGAVGVDLGDRFQSVSVARVSSRGVETECVTSADEARAFLLRAAPDAKTAAPAAPALEEK